MGAVVPTIILVVVVNLVVLTDLLEVMVVMVVLVVVCRIRHQMVLVLETHLLQVHLKVILVARLLVQHKQALMEVVVQEKQVTVMDKRQVVTECHLK